MAMEAALRMGELPACFVFAPEDEVAVEYYLIPRLLGWPPQMDGLILEDDPLSSTNPTQPISYVAQVQRSLNLLRQPDDIY